METAPVAVQTVRPAQTVTEIQSTVYRIHSTAQPNAAANTRKGLSLTVSLHKIPFIYTHIYTQVLTIHRVTARTNVGSSRNV